MVGFFQIFKCYFTVLSMLLVHGGKVFLGVRVLWVLFPEISGNNSFSLKGMVRIRVHGLTVLK